ncbi:MAG TPA: hypothetical protein VMR41_04700 [Patescibacteria group bacterium]|nr:hypothetical protein [Patescibacteria group bacterium]
MKFARRVAPTILYNREKKILLQLRTKDASYYPGFWGFFSEEEIKSLKMNPYIAVVIKGVFQYLQDL